MNTIFMETHTSFCYNEPDWPIKGSPHLNGTILSDEMKTRMNS